MDFGFNLAQTSLYKVFHAHPQVSLAGLPMAKRFFGGSQDCG
jgi:hypothetical protein